MIDLNKVEIISINTVVPEQSIRAINYSCNSINFCKKTIFSHAIPENITEDINYIQIRKLSSRYDYSDFVIKELPEYISADFVLIIHDDGFVINPHLWNDEFLNYDYIGAPWPGPLNTDKYRVGNGGFSIRSKKLINFLKNLKYENNHEDWLIGVTYNDYLIENGFKFAPVHLAMKFSLELPIEECVYDINNTFGFHSSRSIQHREKINLIVK